MNIAICEDNEKASKKLTDIIMDWADARRFEVNVKHFCNAESFLAIWPDISFDLAFLDIEMGNISGIHLSEIIRKTDKAMMLVFLTSHKQYSLEGYAVDALHYLIKPLSSAKLLPVLDKAHLLWANSHRDFLVISNSTEQYRLPFNDIYYISMMAHNAEISTIDKKHHIRMSAKELSEKLPPCFIRCHRSHIINLYKVDCVYKESVRLSNGIELPVSRNCIRQLKEAFYNLHMG